MAEERVTNPGGSSKPQQKTRAGIPRWGIYLLIALTLWAGFNFFRALRLPLEVTETVATQDLTYDTEFGYRVFPKPSLLYPEAEPLDSGEAFFTRVTRDVEVGFTIRVSPDPPLPLSGTYRVWLVLEAPELWERSYLLQEETGFVSERGSLVEISGTFPLDLQERLAFADRVREETGVSPRDGYNLYLRPVIRLKADLPGDAGVREYAPQFGFNVNGYRFSPIGEVTQKEEKHFTSTDVKPNQMKIMGRSLPMTTARYLFGIIFLLGVGALVVRLLGRLQHLGWERKTFEAAYINRRYRGRIVRARGIEGIPADRPVLKMNSFAELLRIADEREKPIICVVDEFGNPVNTYTYYVLDEDNLFTYSVTEPKRRHSRKTFFAARIGTEG